MKILGVAVVSYLLCWSALASEQRIIEKPTKRMTEISEKYHLTMAFVMRIEQEKNQEYWVFIGSSPKHKFGVVPVVVKKDSPDHDVEIAILASENCASFYDKLLEKEKAAEQQKNQSGI